MKAYSSGKKQMTYQSLVSVIAPEGTRSSWSEYRFRSQGGRFAAEVTS